MQLKDFSQKPLAESQQPTAKSFPLRRIIRVLLITMVSLLLLLVLAASVLLWVVFTPDRLTPIVQNQLDKHSPYQASVERVELTFFSTFPQFSIHIDHLLVISPFAEAPSDTLLKAGRLAGTIDIRALWKDNEIILNNLKVAGGFANIYIDSLGHSNYARLLAVSERDTVEQAEMPFQLIQLQEISFHDTDLSFIDLAAGIQAQIGGLHASLSGVFKENVFDGTAIVAESNVSFSYQEEKYLDDDSIGFELPVRLDMLELQADIHDAALWINGLGITLRGSVGYDADHGALTTNLQYSGSSWIIKDLLALIPPAYLAPLGDFSADGRLDAHGVISGVLSDTLFPLINANLSIDEGTLIYEWIPVPLSGIKGDAYLFLDMNNLPDIFLDIGRMEARSHASWFQTTGRVKDLLGNVRLDLVTNANVLVEEFQGYIPAEMGLLVKGRANGRLHKGFFLEDAMAMKLEQMLMTGSVELTDFTMIYDTIMVRTDRSNIDFSMPEPSPKQEKTGFARIDVRSDSLQVAINESAALDVHQAHIFMEMSDLRDTTAIPFVHGTYDIQMVYAHTDTIHAAITHPNGLFSISPNPHASKYPTIYLEYASQSLKATAGNEMVQSGNIWIISNVLNDPSQDDPLSGWKANGFFIMADGVVQLSDLASPLQIPTVRMDFDPDILTIQESKVIIDESDFSLSGALRNVLSYVKGDSLLRGNFLFHSDYTDLNQLMRLTSGIGKEVEAEVNVEVEVDAEVENDDASFSGPYMVPRGLDITLDANVRQATFGPDTMSNIRGEVHVRDGILVFDGIDFTTPAADMRLTAMYRTPRKNHLYLGIDYHMFDIDIERLLRMIPDIDTLMPMLRSFRGNGEFHLAVETYLDSLYNIKKSTLRGASSIRGNDLVLLDGETFSEIARTLRFSRRAENRVDSLSAEFTIFREEIDIYPFLIVMDRYQAVVAGRHNFDMSFNYHISLVDSPLPVRLGIDITGTLDNMSYRLASPRYAALYRPTSRRAVDSRQLEFRRMIREALMQNIE